MTGREQIAIARHVPLSVLEETDQAPGIAQVVPCLVFIQLRYTGMSAVQAAEAVGISGDCPGSPPHPLSHTDGDILHVTSAIPRVTWE